MRTDEAAVLALAERQHGVFRRDQARAAGLSSQVIGRRLAGGEWHRVYEQVYRPAGAQPSWHGRLLAACWAGGPRGAASHRSAARLWGLPGGRDGFVEVVCPRWRRARHNGVVVHESTVLDRWDLRLVGEIPVTSPERTLLDLGSCYGLGMVELAVDAARHRKLVTAETLWSTLGRLGRQGRNGAGVLRSVLQIRDSRHRAPESVPETRLLQLLRRSGLPDPIPQYEIFDRGEFVARVDAAYPEWRIAIEYDSVEYHAGRDAVIADSARRSRIIAAGWHPVTATIADLQSGGAELCDAIRFLRQQ